jgi:hypothetical protein
LDSPGQEEDLAGHYVSPGFGRVLEKLLALSSLEGSKPIRISQSSLPGGGLSCGGCAAPFLGGSILCQGVVISAVSPGFLGDYTVTAQRMAQSKDRQQNGGEDAKFLSLANSWAQVRSQCFSGKRVKYLLEPW